MKFAISPLVAARLSSKVVKLAIFATASVAGVTVVSSSVFAGLTATTFNQSPQSVATGTLKITQAPSGVAGLTGGFVSAITLMAPGDTINRFVDITQGGSLDGATPTLTLLAGSATTLTTDPTNGLQVTVKTCTVAYTTVTGLCSGGTETTVLGAISANSLLSAQTLLNFGVTSASVTRLKFILSLPAGSEITSNGTLPGGTVQGVTSNLTWTFNEALRTNTNTNS
jgi:hypothetical protein